MLNVAFSEATFTDCTRRDGLNLDINLVWPYQGPTLHLPSDFPAPSPTLVLIEQMVRIQRAWIHDNETARRMIINAILTEVILNGLGAHLRGYCEVNNDLEFSNGVKYTGFTDYMIGTGLEPRSVDTLVLVVKAKGAWLPSAIFPQVICEAGCLLKRRIQAGKETPVFAILTNGENFQFFALDVDSKVYSSGQIVLDRGSSGSFADSPSLIEILRWCYWFVSCMNAVSPRVAGMDLDQVEINSACELVRACFGRKY